MLFGQFVGLWDMEVMFYDKDERKGFHEPGEWAFAWVLDGRAVQDVLVYPNPNDKSDQRRIGTTLRFYDPQIDVWRIIWVGVVSGNVGVMTGRQVGSEIWIEEREADGSLTRWLFKEISKDRFHWKGMTSVDGTSWQIDQEMIARRQSR
jgi:hypothetical protein